MKNTFFKFPAARQINRRNYEIIFYIFILLVINVIIILRFFLDRR